MKLYENIVIGNFLYALGFSVRSKSNRDIQPSMVNLLQQTPADKVLGDVLIEFTGTMRLIEFKQENNNSKKEQDKHRAIKEVIMGDERLEALSRNVHWFVETAPTEQAFKSRVTPYLDAYPKSRSCFTLWEFIDVTANDAVNELDRFTSEELKRYLRLIANANGSDYVGTGGLLVHLDNTGSIRYTELADMMQMRLSHREFKKEMENRYEKQNSRVLSQARERDRSLDRGISR